MTKVFFDCETGGLELTAPIIQIAAVAVDEAWKEVGSFEIKVRVDETKCTPEALKLNSYDAQVWSKEAKPDSAAVYQFKAFLDAHRSVQMTSKRGKPYSVARVGGHNVRFDLDRVSLLFKNHGEFFPVQFNTALDTLQGAVWHFELTKKDPPENYKLETLATYFGIDTSHAHDALADVRMTAALARALLGE